MNFNKVLSSFINWRLKHIPDKNFMLILAVFVGIVAGIAAVVIKNSVYFIQKFLISTVEINYLYFIYPFIGIALVLAFTRLVVRKKLGHGVPMVLHAISKNNGKIEKHNMFSRIVGSSITVGFGGSVGLEGPIVATGAAIGSNVGRKLNLNYKQVFLMIGCASTGAIAAIFNAPIAAIIFTLEVIMLNLTMAAILPLLLASISASLTSYLFMGQNIVYFVETTDPFLLNHVPFYILLGVLTGLVSVYFSKVYLLLSRLFSRIKNWKRRFLVGVSVLGTLIFIFPSMYGEGYEVINSSLRGDYSYLFDNTFYNISENFLSITILFLLIIFFKAFATGATFGAGGVGGIFAPSLFLGANIGLLMSFFFTRFGYDVSATNFALVGMAGTIAGIIHAPMTAIFMIAEITAGYELFVPLMIVSSIAYFTAKIFMNNSVYTNLLAKRGELITHNPDKNMLTLLKAENLIETNFVSVNENQTLKELVGAIEKSNRNLNPVIDVNYRLKGVVVLDKIRHIIFKPELYDKTLVKDLMIRPPHIIDIEKMSVRDIVEMFEESSSFNLPVVKNGRYLGFISRAKLFSSYRELLKKMSDE